jgi:hypothetical protein
MCGRASVIACGKLLIPVKFRGFFAGKQIDKQA